MVIRHDISPRELRNRIRAEDANWYADAKAARQALPANPRSADFDEGLWGRVKSIYMNLQGSKCIYCETKIEGAISNDVEHFRPKTKVVHWHSPPSFVTAGLAVTNPATIKGDPGYASLAFDPWNYAASCKVCNTVLKKNYFPIGGPRNSASTAPRRMKAERAFFIYPIGDCDEDPRELIRFVGMHPEPIAAPGSQEYFRALVTIEVFQLNDADTRDVLFEGRALLLGELYSWLDRRETAATPVDRQNADDWIDILLAPQRQHSSCLQCFADLYESDPNRAQQLIDDAKYFLQTGAIR